MLKKKFMLALAIITSLSTSSLVVHAETNDPLTTSSKTVASVEYNNIAFDNVNYKEAPSNLINYIDDNKENPGFITYKDYSTGCTYIAILRGAKRTSGYDINVSNVKKSASTTNITINETNPDQDAMVLQVITFPYTIIKINSLTSNIAVTTTTGVRYPFINDWNYSLKKY